MDRVQLNLIRIDGDTQSRCEMDEHVIIEYAAEMDGGAAFDPGKAVYDGKHYWLWDGFHRFHAERRRGSDTMALEVTKGTLDDARRMSLGANKEHRGMRRTNKDKRRAVERALSWYPGYSQHRIAELCGVSQRFVSSMKDRQPTTENRSQSVVTGRDGRTYNTSNIGKAPQPKAPAPTTFAELQKLAPPPTLPPAPAPLPTPAPLPAPPAEGVLQPEQQPKAPSRRQGLPAIGVPEMDFAQYMRNIQGTANHLT